MKRSIYTKAMKKLLTIILLFSFLTAHAQDGKALKILGTAFAWSILNGIGDGLNDSGHKTAGHAVNALSYATLIGGTIWSEPERKDWLRYLTIAAGMRYVTFDASYNLTRDLRYDYIGTTAGIDKAMTKVPAHFRTFTRGVVLCGTIGFAFNEFPREKNYRHNKTFIK
jgi:hypothetical protein